MIKPSHRTIKQQAARHGMKTTIIDGEIFAAEEIPVRVPHSQSIFGRDMLELPICEINTSVRFQDAQKLKLRSYVYSAYKMAEERRQKINRMSRAQIEESKDEMADELLHLSKIKVPQS